MHAQRTIRIPVILFATLLFSAMLAAQPPHQGARTQRVFSVHDSDADGYLSRGEYEALLQQRRQRQAASGRPLQDFRPSPGFDKVDTDGDQLISMDELTTVLGRRLRLRQGHR